MSNYICKECGARLDPGERCDCMSDTGKKNEIKKELIFSPTKAKNKQFTNSRQGVFAIDILS